MGTSKDEPLILLAGTKGTRREAYLIKIHCKNCGAVGIVRIPKRRTIASFLRTHFKCEKCSSTKVPLVYA